MVLRKLRLSNYRNYEAVELQFSEAVNLFYGDNAQGKTNLLEAIHVLALTKSFRTANDRELIKHRSDRCEIHGDFWEDSGVHHSLTLLCDTVQGKSISLNRKRPPSNSAVIGKFPVVHFSPESHRITSGAPSERRRFIDILLCQSSAIYLADLQDYNRVLRQRNALLGKPEPPEVTSLHGWDRALATYGCKIIAARFQFVKTYSDILQQAYTRITSSTLPFRMVYRSSLQPDQLNTETFLQHLSNERRHELRRRQTMIGPHRDDFRFELNGKDMRRFGSRGEHKSALLALKIAETEFLREKSMTLPIVLIDDLTSELDQSRSAKALEFFQTYGQLFVTSISPMTLPEGRDHALFEIVDGKVSRVTVA